MIPTGKYVSITEISVPRVGGGDPKEMNKAIDKARCSPRRRG